MFEKEKAHWLALFKNEFLSRFQDPEKMADSIKSSELLYINNTVFNPEMMSMTGKTVDSILQILDRARNLSVLLEGGPGIKDEEDNLYTLQDRITASAQRMGFSPREYYTKMPPSEVLKITSISFAATRDLERDHINAFYSTKTVELADDDNKIRELLKDRNEFMTGLYRAAKEIVINQHQQHADKLMQARMGNNNPKPVTAVATAEEKEKYTAAYGALEVTKNGITNVNPKITESISDILTAVTYLKNNNMVSMNLLIGTLEATQQALHDPRALGSLIAQTKKLEVVDPITAKWLSELQREISDFRSLTAVTRDSKAALNALKLPGSVPSNEDVVLDLHAITTNPKKM